LKKLSIKVAKSSRRDEKGFTLIELLVVIALLGILAAVVIPNASSFVKKGYLSAANGELASIQTAAVANLPLGGDYSSAFGIKPGSLGALTSSINMAIKGSYWINVDASVDISTSPSTGSNATAAGFPYYPNLTWDTTALQFK